MKLETDNPTLAVQFTVRYAQFKSDGKEELKAFELTFSEFENQIIEIKLYPLKYTFADGSSCVLKDNYWQYKS